MTSIVTIIKEIIIPHRKGNIRLNPEFLVLDNAHIQGFLLGTDYQRIYSIDIYNGQNRRIVRYDYETDDNITINQQYY
ncbi:hypothetical protein O181_030670, partial [Austropuccinia psidii MF-1]|nr:hypothetical protein [Austropuccinia psidii MF-1]